MSQYSSLQHTSVMFIIYSLSLSTSVAHFSVNLTNHGMIMAKLLGNTGRFAHLKLLEC